MNPSEFRKGNLLLGLKDSIITVDYFTPDFVYTPVTRSAHRIEKLSAIKLDEDWLIKFGFVENNNNPIFPNYQKEYTNVNIQRVFQVQRIDDTLFNWLEGNTNVHLQYVHQLQNLFYSIVGKELTLNKPL